MKAFLDRYHRVEKPERFDVSYRPTSAERSGGVYNPPEKIRPEKRFSRMIDQASERRRKQAEARGKKDPE